MTSKGASIASAFPRGVVSENALLSEPLRLPDLKTASDFLQGLLDKLVLSNRCGSIAIADNKQGRFDSVNFSEKGVVSENLVLSNNCVLRK